MASSRRGFGLHQERAGLNFRNRKRLIILVYNNQHSTYDKYFYSYRKNRHFFYVLRPGVNAVYETYHHSIPTGKDLPGGWSVRSVLFNFGRTSNSMKFILRVCIKKMDGHETKMSTAMFVRFSTEIKNPNTQNGL